MRLNTRRFIYLFFSMFSLLFFIYVVRQNVENFVKNSAFFYLEKVNITGLKYIRQEDILDKLPKVNTVNIFSLRTTELKDEIEKDKRIKVLEIRTQLPNELFLSLQEVYGDYLILVDGKDYYDVTKDMKIISKNEEILEHDKIILSMDSDFIRMVDIDLEKHILRLNMKKERTLDEIIGSSLFLKSVISNLEALKENERDFLSLVSLIHFQKESYTELFLRGTKQMIKVDGFLNTDDIRKARYAYIYGQSIKRELKSIDIRGEMVKYAF